MKPPRFGAVAMRRRGIVPMLGLAVLLSLRAPTVMGQHGTAKGEWRTHGGDLGSTRYAPLDQITAANFNRLEIAWRFKTVNLGPQPDFLLQATPLMVRGTLFASGGSRRAV